MARQYLAEGLEGSFPFVADKEKIVVESLPNGKTRTRIPGRFSVCDETNGNGRRYGKRIWEKNLSPGSPLMKAIAENGAFGLLEHPKDGQVDLRSPISHVVTEAKLQKGTDGKGKEIWEVLGEIQVIDAPGFPDGQRLKSLIEHTNYCPRVSSRGFGSLVRAADGIDDVQEDYVCEGWDVVIKPSFDNATLAPARESKPQEAAKPAASPSTAPVVETVNNPPPTPPATANSNAAPVTTMIVQTPGQPPQVISTPAVSVGSPPITLETVKDAAPPVKPTESSPEKVMNLSEIKTQIAAMASTDPSKLKPQRFAEGMSQLSTLHQEVAKYEAEDKTRSWTASQLHEEIKNIETSWAETQLAPGKTAVKLKEDRTKLAHVIKAVAQTALTFKNKLGESMKAATRQTALLNEVVERGQAWRQQAKQTEAERDAYRRRFMMASEALHQLGAKYKADITEMGKAHLQGEFKDKLAASPELAALLKEAAMPKALVPIRLALEGKIPIEKAKAVLEGRVSLDEATKGLAAPASAAAPAAGAKPGEAGKPTAQPVAENQKPAAAAAPVSQGTAIVLSPKPTDPRDVNESIAMVKRMSPQT